MCTSEKQRFLCSIGLEKRERGRVEGVVYKLESSVWCEEWKNCS